MWTFVLSQARFQVLLFVVVDTVEGSHRDIEVSVCGPYAITQTLESAYVVIARHPIIEKSSPYYVIGVGLLKNQTPPSY